MPVIERPGIEIRERPELGLQSNMELRHLGHLIKNNYSQTALLKELMTVPPMTAEQHASVMRKRIKLRRMVEDAKEVKSIGTEKTFMD